MGMGLLLSSSQDSPLVGVATLDRSFLIGDDKGPAALVGLVACRGVPEQGAEEHNCTDADRNMDAIVEVDGAVDCQVAGAALFFAVGL